MPPATWPDPPETGFPLVDAQHRELLLLLDRLAAAIEDEPRRAEANELLATIALRAIKHFQTEELLMKEAAYPERQAHADEHQDLILKVRGLQYKQAKGEPLARDLARFLIGWFDHHIREVDMGYVWHLKAAGEDSGHP